MDTAQDARESLLSAQTAIIKKACELILTHLPECDEVELIRYYLNASSETFCQREYDTYKAIKKHWRLFKKHNLTLPKKYLPHFHLTPTADGALIINLSKGSEYILTWIGDEEMICTCPAGEVGTECSHIEYAKPRLPAPVVPEIEPAAPAIAACNDPSYIPVEILPGILATAEQWKALKELENFVLDGSTIHLLSGFAGTGKTLLLQALINRLHSKGYEQKIVFTAPTNKAVQVLKRMADRWKLGVDCLTVASLLGLKPVINEKTGEQKFIPDANTTSQIELYDLVIVDETSMIDGVEHSAMLTQSEKGLWNHLIDATGLLTKMLFVGDYAQLPPVGGDISPVFLHCKSYSLLTQPQRYNGSIAALADDLRQNLDRRSEPFFVNDHSEDRLSGIFVDSQDTWLGHIKRAFTSNKYLTDPDYCRVLAYRNKTVAAHNAFIRSAIYGDNAPRFMVGERLIAQQYYAVPMPGSSDKKTLFPTSAEMEVASVTEGTEGRWDVWHLSVDLLDSQADRVTFPVLHERCNGEYDKYLKSLFKEAKDGRSGAWRKFYTVKEYFADVDYAYAMTTHKAQGSTFQNVFLDAQDVLTCRGKMKTIQFPWGKQRIYERNQLLYTAVTRTAQRLFIFE